MWSYLLAALAVFLTTTLLSLLVVGVLLVSLPADYFLESSLRNLWVDRHPVVRFLLHLLKNLSGVGLIALGLLLSLPGIPGQGLLTVLAGVLLLDFPGKRGLELRFVSQPRILSTINRLRTRCGREPLQLTVETPTTSSSATAE